MIADIKLQIRKNLVDLELRISIDVAVVVGKVTDTKVIVKWI